MSILSIVILTAFYNILKPKKLLPIYQPAEVNLELVDSSLHYKKKYHKISDFELINQNGDIITQSFYNNKIYVADFFLPHMSNNLSNNDRSYVRNPTKNY